jgi:hypothetical protein
MAWLCDGQSHDSRKTKVQAARTRGAIYLRLSRHRLDPTLWPFQMRAMGRSYGLQAPHEGYRAAEARTIYVTCFSLFFYWFFSIVWVSIVLSAVGRDRWSTTDPNPFKSIYKLAEGPEASGGLACCGRQKALLIEKGGKLPDIIANLFFGDTEFRCEIVNNVVE